MNSILVIEDHPEMRRNIATILEMENYVVYSCSDGRAGVNLARAQRPDIVLCDVMMPGMDGHEVLRQLRADPATASLPFIFLTAKGEKPDVRAGMNLGADDYLTKPVSASDLLATIETRLVRSRTVSRGEFKPDFRSAEPLRILGLTTREAEVLLWVAQGKSNADIATILGMTVHTVKKHLQNIFEKLGVETRNGATFRAFEILGDTPGAPAQ